MDVGALLDWYERVRRPLPWRETRDPYALLVSRGDAPADPGAAGGAVLRALALAVSGRSLRFRPRLARRAGAVERAGYNRRALALQNASRVVAERVGRLICRPCRAWGRTRRRRSGRSRGTAGRGGGHERAAGAVAARRGAPRRARCRARGRAAPGGPRGDLQPGDDGARRDGLPAAGARSVVRVRSRRVAAGRAAPARRRGRRAFRGHRSLGPRADRRGAAGGEELPVDGERASARWPGSSATAWSFADPTARVPSVTCVTLRRAPYPERSWIGIGSNAGIPDGSARLRPGGGGRASPPRRRRVRGPRPPPPAPSMSEQHLRAGPPDPRGR